MSDFILGARVDSVKERTSERVSWPLCRHRPTYSLVCGAWRMRTCCYLQFSPGVELLQAVHGLLSMHAGGHGGPVLEEVGERSVSGRQAHPRSPHSQNILWMGWVSCEEQFSVLGDGINILARDICFKKCLFIYFAVLGLSSSMQDLQSSVQSASRGLGDLSADGSRPLGL